MVKLSTRGGKKNPGYRIIALWRDGGSGLSQQIQLPDSSEAVVLTVNVKEKTEFAADGRSDHGVTGYPILERCDFI
jgi:hypothetical protein